MNVNVIMNCVGMLALIVGAWAVIACFYVEPCRHNRLMLCVTAGLGWVLILAGLIVVIGLTVVRFVPGTIEITDAPLRVQLLASVPPVVCGAMVAIMTWGWYEQVRPALVEERKGRG